MVRFHTGWRPSRPFPLDMAGFAVSLKTVLANPDACFDGNAPMGFLESSFLQGVVTMEELEPRADNCSQVRASEDYLVTPLEHQVLHSDKLLAADWLRV